MRPRSLLIGIGLALLGNATPGSEQIDSDVRATPGAFRQLGVPRVFGDNMVLQRGVKIPVWGWALPGGTVTVDFSGQSRSTMVPASGRWMVHLDPMPARSIPGRLTVAAEETTDALRFENVIVGDVYLSGGQSNMKIGLGASSDGAEEAARADHPNIRFITIEAVESPRALKDDIVGRWERCTPQTAGSFSAVSYFFARRIHAETEVPIGILIASQGVTSAESWISRRELDASAEGRAYASVWEAAQRRFDPEQARIDDERRMADHRQRIAAARAAGDKLHRRNLRPPRPTIEPRLHRGWPSTYYNGMIAPIRPFAIRGAIWYQGEQNARRRGFAYRTVLPMVIDQWRLDFRNLTMPFYIVQFPGWYKERDVPQESSIAEAREAQLLTHRKTPNTGLAVIIDTNEKGRTHPKNKRLAGERLALWALANEHGKDVVASGPLYESMRTEGNKIILSFDHIGGGLIVGERTGLVEVVAVDQPLKSFAIAGADRKFVWAKARIHEDEVVVWSKQVPEPVAVRYAWADNPSGCNLYNRAGLPASPFRTDDWPAVSQGVLEPRLPAAYRPGNPE
jgi:sialate O-acetylesterase